MIVQIIHEAHYNVVTTLIPRWKQRNEDTTFTQRGLNVVCLLIPTVVTVHWQTRFNFTKCKVTYKPSYKSVSQFGALLFYRWGAQFLGSAAVLLVRLSVFMGLHIVSLIRICLWQSASLIKRCSSPIGSTFSWGALLFYRWGAQFYQRGAPFLGSAAVLQERFSVFRGVCIFVSMRLSRKQRSQTSQIVIPEGNMREPALVYPIVVNQRKIDIAEKENIRRNPWMTGLQRIRPHLALNCPRGNERVVVPLVVLRSVNLKKVV